MLPLLTLILGMACSGSGDVPAPALANSAASATAPAAGPAAPSTRATGGGGQAPVYVMLYTHHYLGLGGYYPTAAQVRDVAEACVDAGLADECVLFLDGLLVGRLAEQDPTLDDYVKQHGFPVGYHGEETHGPYPVVVSVGALNVGKNNEDQGLYEPGMDFAAAVDAVHDRYTHGYSGPAFDSVGYLQRGSGGSSSRQVGGIKLVEQWSGADPQIVPGHALFMPPATMAFAKEADIALLQAAGPLAPHFLAASKNQELASRVHAWLGEEDLLFWYMGTLAEKGSEASMFPMWNKGSLVQKAGKGGAREAPDSRGYLGPHLLPAGLAERLRGVLTPLVEGPKGDRAGRKPPKNADGSWPGREGQQGGNRELKQRMLAEQAAVSAGEDVRAAAAALDRSRTRLVSMKIDGSGKDVAETLAFMKQWAARDSGVELVTPRELRDKVAPSQVTVEAQAVARAVLDSWQDGPADSLSVGGTPLSQADAFEVLARHLAGQGDRITTTDVLGPIGPASSLVQGKGKVSADQVRAAAATAVAAIDKSPHHAMPVNVAVGDGQVGFHQLHWLMATLVAEGGSRLAVPDTGHAPPFAKWLADALGRKDADPPFWMECQYWTIKPAVWR